VQREVERAERQRMALLAGDAPTRHAIVCGDTYRLTLDQGGARASIQWYAPKQDAARHPQVQALGELVRVIDTLQTIAAADGKVRIAQVTP
jgi:23S rRNA G2069 N7-methylase RlmK/C1962 C5-methylase RlmI